MRGEADATTESATLRELFTEVGGELEPLFPGIDDVDMASQFRAEVPDDVPDTELERIRARPGVLAAYAKAPGAPPLDS